MNHPANSGKVYKPVWKCIYCGHEHTKSEPCGSEHIIPLSPGGPLILPRSSCASCSKETSAFEEVCSRDIFGPYRLAGNLPTRHPDQRPSTLKIHTHSEPGTIREEHSLPLKDYPVIGALMPELEVAGIFRGSPSTEAFYVVPRIINLVRSPEALKDVEVRMKQFEVTREFKITEFARLLAKIAHAYAVAEFGLGAFEPFLPPFILGKSLNLPDFVGGVTSPTPDGSWFLGEHGTKVKTLIEHYLNWEVVRAVDQIAYLTVVIQLLQSYAPKYRVVVARA